MVHTQGLTRVINESIEKISELLAKDAADQKKPYLSSHKEKIQKELELNSDRIQAKIFDGLTDCLIALKEDPDLSTQANNVIKELTKCMAAIKSTKQFIELGQALLQNSSWKQNLDISNSCMLHLYQGARRLFEQREFTQAENAFFAICSLDPSQFAFWVGLGHACFHEMNYQQAIQAYSMASALHKDNVWPHIWAANCFEEEGDFFHAKMALEEALSIAKREGPVHGELVDSLKQRIQKI